MGLMAHARGRLFRFALLLLIFVTSAGLRGVSYRHDRVLARSTTRVLDTRTEVCASVHTFEPILCPYLWTKFILASRYYKTKYIRNAEYGKE